ncbi:hypothetical protein [Terasakiella pusilla]|uniref:hypothetical protein n=1 Tax=Terasakiella pusilla TaxID=64973 RepID=UPI003AA7EBF4
MNKPRRPQTVEAAIAGALSEIDEDGIKDLTGKSRSTVNKWSDDECELNHIPFYQAVNLAAGLTAMGVQERFTEAFKAGVARKVCELGGSPAHSPLDPSDRVLTLVEAVGRACGEIRMAQDPDSPSGKKYSACEKAEIAGHLQELIDHALLCIKDLEAAV